MPKVSVIIPTYNRAARISRAINSVLSQTFNDYEIIIVDDGSTDDTAQVLKQFNGKIKYIFQENQGSAVARNRGIQEARGEYIAFLDSDDFWVPEKLTEQVRILESHPKVGIVYSRMPIINEKGEKIGMKPAGISGRNYQELLEDWGDLPTSTVVTRKECFEKAGLFDHNLQTMQDIDMWIRIAKYYDLYEIENKVLAYYCRHAQQITRCTAKALEGRVILFKKLIGTLDDALHTKFVKRLSLEQYVLSRVYFQEGQYVRAWLNLKEAFARHPKLGTLFIRDADSVMTKVMKTVKPIGYLVVCSFLAFCSRIRKHLIH